MDRETWFQSSTEEKTGLLLNALSNLADLTEKNSKQIVLLWDHLEQTLNLIIKIQKRQNSMLDMIGDGKVSQETQGGRQ